MSRARQEPGLATRLLSAQVLVVLAGALTAWLVAVLVGPPLFHDHLQRAEAADPGDEILHAEQAFRSATAIALSVALLAALLAALAGSIYVTRRIGRSVGIMADAAATIAAGRYDTQVLHRGSAPSSTSSPAPSTRWRGGSKPSRARDGGCSATWDTRCEPQWQPSMPTSKGYRTE